MQGWLDAFVGLGLIAYGPEGIVRLRAPARVLPLQEGYRV